MKYTLEDVKKSLEGTGWKVISDNYKSLETEMIFECTEGHRVYAPWKKIRQKRVCPICQQNFEKREQTIIPKSKNKIRVLALDQATKITGWSIFDSGELIKFGTFETSLGEEMARDNAIKHWFISMIENWRPDHIGIEGIQLQENSEGRQMGVTVFETLARLQGILMETAYEYKIPFKVCPTNTWRAHCGVKGKSRSDKKRSMQLIAKRLYDITLSDDEADAIGIGKYVSETCGKEVSIESWE